MHRSSRQAPWQSGRSVEESDLISLAVAATLSGLTSYRLRLLVIGPNAAAPAVRTPTGSRVRLADLGRLRTTEVVRIRQGGLP